MNSLLLVGRIVKINDNNIKLAIKRYYKNEYGIYETDFFTIKLNDNLMEKIKLYCRKGDLIGIKGKLETDNNKVVVIAERLTFLASQQIGSEETNE